MIIIVIIIIIITIIIIIIIIIIITPLKAIIIVIRSLYIFVHHFCESISPPPDISPSICQQIYYSGYKTTRICYPPFIM